MLLASEKHSASTGGDVMIMYKVGDPDKTLYAPTVIWEEGFAGLDEISLSNGWKILNTGCAVALLNPEQNSTTMTVNFGDTNIGKNIAVTVATNGRDDVGVMTAPIVTDEWPEEINETIQAAMLNYFVNAGNWTTNANGVKGPTEPGFNEGFGSFNTAEAEDIFDAGDSVAVVNALD
jgi:hypothetical protein